MQDWGCTLCNIFLGASQPGFLHNWLLQECNYGHWLREEVLPGCCGSDGSVFQCFSAGIQISEVCSAKQKSGAVLVPRWVALVLLYGGLFDIKFELWRRGQFLDSSTFEDWSSRLKWTSGSTQTFRSCTICFCPPPLTLATENSTSKLTHPFLPDILKETIKNVIGMAGQVFSWLS